MPIGKALGLSGGGGGGGSAPATSPAPSSVPRRVEVDVAAAEREERDIASKRRTRNRSILTRGIDLGIAETSKTQLTGR